MLSFDNNGLIEDLNLESNQNLYIWNIDKSIDVLVIFDVQLMKVINILLIER